MKPPLTRPILNSFHNHYLQNTVDTPPKVKSAVGTPQVDVVNDVWLKLKPQSLHSLYFGDKFRIGNLTFGVFRFNTGFGGLQGYRSTMEDEEVAFQDLGISDEIPVSFFAVYDGWAKVAKFSVFSVMVAASVPIFLRKNYICRLFTSSKC